MKEKTHFAINIGRQLGSGGRDIGVKLAEKLGIKFYDKELLRIASEESGLASSFFEQADEKARRPFAGGSLGLKTSLFGDTFVDCYLGNDLLFKIQSDVIVDLSEKQSAVFVGRCADYVLRNHPYSLNVFITAGDADRIQRIMKRHNLSERKAKDMIQKTDKKRASYYNYYSNKRWGQADSYELCINSGVGVDETVDTIIDYLKKKYPELVLG